MEKLCISIPFLDVVHIADDPSLCEMNAPTPSEYIMEVATLKGTLKVIFCFESAQQKAEWVEELNWRLEALHRGKVGSVKILMRVVKQTPETDKSHESSKRHIFSLKRTHK